MSSVRRSSRTQSNTNSHKLKQTETPTHSTTPSAQAQASASTSQSTTQPAEPERDESLELPALRGRSTAAHKRKAHQIDNSPPAAEGSATKAKAKATPARQTQADSQLATRAPKTTILIPIPHSLKLEMARPRTSTASSSTRASAKSLGKRRALSPPTTAAQPPPDSTPAPSTKRQKSVHVTETPILSTQSTHQTRSRSRALSSASSDATALTQPTPVPTHKKTKKQPQKMPRKGSRATRAAQTKARAMEDDEDEVLAAGGGSRDVEMAEAGSSQRSQRMETDDDDDEREGDHSHDEEVEIEDDSASEDDGEEDEDDVLHDHDGHDYEHDDHEAYEAALDLAGDEIDEDAYATSGGESDLIDPPQTFDEDGSPIPNSSLLDREDELARAMDAAAAHAAAARGAAGAAGLGGLPGGGGGPFGFGGGAGFRALHGMMSGVGTRLKGLLSTLKDKKTPTQGKLEALQDLSELLSISTEDTLAGYFNVEQFCKELVTILKGDPTAGQGGGGGGEDSGMTIDEMMAFGMDPGEGGGGVSEEANVQMMLLACRCLANLMEALPGSSHSVVYAGAVPVLCDKLREIVYVEVAEDAMSALHKISEEVPSSIVRENGLNALVQFLPFFSSHTQRTAVGTAANCCRSLTVDSFSMVADVMPTFKDILSYPDQRVVEHACLAVVRIVDSYRHHPDKLEQLLKEDVLLAVRVLLNPDSTAIGTGTYTQILKMLSTASKASPEVATALVELNLASTLYHLLTGVAPGEFPPEGERQILTRGEDDMLVMQNLVQRPKEQIQETLGLVCELLPALPKDGIFDARAFAGKGGKPKPRREESQASSPAEGGSPALGAGGDARMNELLVGGSGLIRHASGTRARELQKEQIAAKRLELLRDGPASRQLTVTRYYALLLPILVDVYAASVNANVRTKALTGLLKIVNFCDKDALAAILTTVPMASFLAGLLSARGDQGALTTSALQLVELLLVKMEDAYQYFFRREGVMYEIERIAAQPIVSVSSRSNKHSATATPLATDATDAPPASGLTRALQQHAASSSAAAPAATLSPADALAKDIITYRARHIRDTYAQADSESAERARNELDGIKALVDELAAFADQAEPSRSRAEKRAVGLVEKVVKLFRDGKNPLSSFELLESGLVEGILRFATDPEQPSAEGGGLPIHRRQELLGKAFLTHSDSISPAPAFSLLVKRLLESLSRMEQFEVELAAQTSADIDSKRHGTSLLARQLKLRLVAEDGSKLPPSCNNITVSIHAIATFQAFNDYLRPRIIAATEARAAGGAGGGSGSARSGLQQFLAAFEAAGGDPGLQTRLAGIEAAAREEAKREAEEASKSGKRAVRRSSRLSAGGGGAQGEGPSTSRNTLEHDEDGDERMEHGEEEEECEEEQQHVEEDEDDEDDVGAFAPSSYGGTVGVETGSPSSRDERPVNLEVADDKVVAKTPDGTRVGTPLAGTSARPSSAAGAAKPKAGSYAAAVKSEPTDFHLEFTVGGEKVSLETTVYGAVHHLEQRANAQPGGGAPRINMWHNIHSAKFRIVPGPAPSPAQEKEKGREAGEEEDSKHSVLSNLPASIPADSQQAKILQLLWVLHSLNSDLADASPELSEEGKHGVISPLPEGGFINNKLTAKLNRQLEEPMIVASGCLPSWSTDLPKLFPFLFAFETRYTFLQSTAFGYARLLQKWIGQARTDSNNGAGGSRRDENLGFLGRLQRQKVRISRDRLLESAFKVFELYGSSRAALEVEFFTEVGSGLGPTLEFYALVSKEFARKDLQMWREGDSSALQEDNSYVHHPLGLFPAPLSDKASTESIARRGRLFSVLGQFVAKALMDSRIIDVNFNRALMKLVLGQSIPATIAGVGTVDKSLAKSLAHLQEYVEQKLAIEADEGLSEEEKEKKIEAIQVQGATIADLTLDFTLPGYDLELKEGGRELSVEMHNLEEYIALVIDWTLHRGVSLQIDKFREGFSTVFDAAELGSFTPSELVMMTGSLEEDWSIEALSNATKADHGFTMDSIPVKHLLAHMSSLSPKERREFLSFITGSPRLPIGGFAALSPPLTIVRKDGGDGALPSVMTCVNYIKCPNYSTKEVLRERFGWAVRDGAEGFHLS